MTRRVCFAIDLVDDAPAIAAYDAFHAPGAVWPEVIADIREQGILDMEIWRCAERCFMILTVEDDFPRAADPAQQEMVTRWEGAVAPLQRPLPNTPPSERWREMSRIFALAEQ